MTATTTYIAIAFGYWGRGETEEAALKQCRKAGAGKREKTIVYRIDDEQNRDAPYVDGHGCMCWFGERTEIATYVRGKRQPATSESAA